MRHVVVLGVSVVLLLGLACGPSEEAIQATVTAKIQVAIAAIPTVTPVPTLTPQPTPTLVPTATPQPTPTPQPTATPQPTPTPQAAPTPLPSPTPQPAPTPQPTPTPMSFPIPITSFTQTYQQVAPSVVYVQTPVGHGSGWVIEAGLVLTNQHVVGTRTSVTLRSTRRAPVTGTVVATDSHRDIALVRYDPALLGLRPLPIRVLTADNVGEPLMALGYSSSDVNANGTVSSASAKTGVFSMFLRLGVLGKQVQTDAVMDPGDSGGPLVDSQGRVVGMNRATEDATPTGQRIVGIFYAISWDEIESILPILKAGRSLP